MLIRKYWALAVAGLLGLAWLTGCKSSQTPLPTAEATMTQTSVPPAALASPSPTSGLEDAYPAPTGVIETVYPPPSTPDQAAYPALTESLAPYPMPGNQTATAAYPEPVDPTQAAYPQPTQPGEAYPGPTQSPVPTDALPATATLQPVLGTATPTSSPVPTNTPLPTVAPTPTATPTPALPPPIRTELSASDPALFQLESGEVQLVEFFAYWCVTCRSMATSVHSLEALYGSRMNFVYLDIDDPATLPFQIALRYRYQPHFFLLDEKGKILQQWIGWQTVDAMRNAIEAALRK